MEFLERALVADSIRRTVIISISSVAILASGPTRGLAAYVPYSSSADFFAALTNAYGIVESFESVPENTLIIKWPDICQLSYWYRRQSRSLLLQFWNGQLGAETWR